MFNMVCIPRSKFSADEKYLELLGLESNDPEALNTMAVDYINGYGCERDIEKGLEYLDKSASLGCDNALINLGIMHLEGDVLDYDEAKAEEYFNKVVEHGDFFSLMKLGNQFEFTDMEEKMIHYHKEALKTKNLEWIESAYYYRLMREVGKYYYDKGDMKMAHEYEYDPEYGKKLFEKGDIVGAATYKYPQACVLLGTRSFHGINEENKSDPRYWNYQVAYDLFVSAGEAGKNRLNRIREFEKQGKWESDRMLEEKLKRFVPTMLDFYENLLSENFDPWGEDGDILENRKEYLQMLKTAKQKVIEKVKVVVVDRTLYGGMIHMSKQEALKVFRKYLYRFRKRLEATSDPEKKEKIDKALEMIKDVVRQILLIETLYHDAKLDDEKKLRVFTGELYRYLTKTKGFYIPRDLKETMLTIIFSGEVLFENSRYDSGRLEIQIYMGSIKRYVEKRPDQEESSILIALGKALFKAYYEECFKMRDGSYNAAKRECPRVIDAVCEYANYRLFNDYILDDSLKKNRAIVVDSFIKGWYNTPCTSKYKNYAKYFDKLMGKRVGIVGEPNFFFQDIFCTSLESPSEARKKFSALVCLTDEYEGALKC